VGSGSEYDALRHLRRIPGCRKERVVRIPATADLHYGLEREMDECTRQLARQVCSSDADLFLLGGDVAERSMESFGECLALFSDFSGPKLFVPGNHDFWIRSVSWEN
jgi:3',5'-cyclic AMP phosphodiesterase CpdA